MATSTVAMRCPACGADLRVVVAAEPPTQWFPCPQCRTPVPVVVPRDPPPLYSWEVYPRTISPAGPAARASLAGASALGSGPDRRRGAGRPGSRPFSSTTGTTRASGSRSRSTGRWSTRSVGSPSRSPERRSRSRTDAGRQSTVLTGPDGAFSFSSVPPGGVTLNVTAAGYRVPHRDDVRVGRLSDAGDRASDPPLPGRDRQRIHGLPRSVP